MLLLLAACASPPSAEVPALSLTLDGAWQGAAGAVTLPAYARPPAGPFTRAIEIPAAWAGARAALVTEATGWRIRVSVDGVEVGTDTGGAWNSRVDLGDALTPGPHVLGLAVEAADEANIVLGETRSPINAWTWGMPRRGEAVLRGRVTLEIGPAARVEHVGARLLEAEGGAFTLEATAWTTGLPAGARVDFSLVRDGSVRLDAGGAEVDADGRARVTVPYDGPRWPDPDGLAWLVADAGGGVVRAERVGPRAAVVDGDTLRLNGERVYYAAWRMSGSGLAGRGPFATLVTQAAAIGANALALHGEVVPGFLLDAADELGLPVVLTPRCDGQMRATGVVKATPERMSFAAEGDHRIVAAQRRHPSLVLWALEAGTMPGGATVHPVYGQSELPLLDEYHNAALGDPTLARVEGGDDQRAPFYRELAWQPNGGSDLGQKLAPVIAAEAKTGIGLVLPSISEDRPDLLRQREGLRDAVAAAGITPMAPGTRRGVSTLRVAVTRAGSPAGGVPVLVDLPAQPTVGAFTDAAGVAWIEVDYVGRAKVHTVDGSVVTEVDITAGAWAPPRWNPSVTRAELPLP